MEKIQEVRFMKCATMLRKEIFQSHHKLMMASWVGTIVKYWQYHHKRVSHVFCEVSETKAHTVGSAYEHGIQIASFLMKNNHFGRDASIIGRLDFHSEMLFYANILVGNTSLCLDIGTVAWFLDLNHIIWFILH